MTRKRKTPRLGIAALPRPTSSGHHSSLCRIVLGGRGIFLHGNIVALSPRTCEGWEEGTEGAPSDSSATPKRKNYQLSAICRFKRCFARLAATWMRAGTFRLFFFFFSSSRDVFPSRRLPLLGEDRGRRGLGELQIRSGDTFTYPREAVEVVTRSGLSMREVAKTLGGRPAPILGAFS